MEAAAWLPVNDCFECCRNDGVLLLVLLTALRGSYD